MTLRSRQEALDFFGKKLMTLARDPTIEHGFKIIEGKTKDSISQKIYDQLSDLNEEQKETVRDLIIDVTDGALNNFLWLFEQEEEMIINLMAESKVVNINDISDGICVDYWNFVDEFSNYKGP